MNLGIGSNEPKNTCPSGVHVEVGVGIPKPDVPTSIVTTSPRTSEGVQNPEV